MDFSQKIKASINAKYPTLTPAEQSIIWILGQNFKEGLGKKITQQEIANTDKWLGCHEQHEGDIVKNKRESTLRQVRQIIRTLRVVHKIPILSDRKGYWIPQTQTEVEDYVIALERKARAQAAAWAETYRCVKETLQVQSSFFDNYEAIQTKEGSNNEEAQG